MAKVIVQFEGQEWSVELREGPNVVGRSSKATIPVKDTNLSREHCEIRLEGGKAVVRDLESRNGILVNGAKTAERPLERGDRIQVGQTTLWFEEKRTPAPSGGTSRRHQKPDAPGPPPAKKRETVRAAGHPAFRDFSAWDRGAAGSPVPWIVAIAGFAIVAAAVVLLPRGSSGGADGAADDGNLLGRAGRFEMEASAGVPGWRLAAGSRSRIGLDTASAHEGRSSLVIEKSADPSDFIVECAVSEEFPVGPGRRVRLSGWTRTEGFGGSVALKVGWTSSVRGPVILEEGSAPVPKPAEWTELTGEFDAPPGAGGFYVALSATGRKGRIFLDDVRAEVLPGAGLQPHRLGAFDVTAGPSGAFGVAVKDRPLLANVQFAVGSEKDGISPQTIAGAMEIKSLEGRVEVKGRVVSPVDLKEAEFSQQILLDDKDLGIVCTVAGEPVRQLERLQVTATLLKPERISGLPGPGESGTFRVVARVEGADLVFEYPEAAAVSLARDRGTAQRIVYSVPIRSGLTKASIAFKIRWTPVAGPGSAEADPVAAAERMVLQRGDYAGALAVLKRSMPGVREPEKRARVAEEIARLEELERREWREAQIASFKAAIAARPELVEAALDRLAFYQRRWPGEPFAAKVQPVRDSMEKLGADQARQAALVRARRMVERARSYAAAGKRALATAVCETVLSRYGDTEAAQEASAILRGFQEP